MDWLKKIPKNLITNLIRLYQVVLSPFLGNRCRFYPSCSHYAQEAIHKHGLLKGGCLAIWRLLRCQPLASGGIDLVPPQNEDRRKHSEKKT